MRYLWLVVLGLSLVVAEARHTWGRVFDAIAQLPSLLFSILCVMGIGFMAWSVILAFVEKLGWLSRLGRLMGPLTRWLFWPHRLTDRSMHYISLNLSANLLGMGNAATPAGLSAMRELQKSNDNPIRASSPMCLFLGINTSSLQLVPMSTMALLGAMGYSNVAAILLPTWIVTGATTSAAIILTKCHALYERSRFVAGESVHD